jgi:hypothetical protein
MADNYSLLKNEKPSAERNAVRQMGISGTTTANSSSEELKVKIVPQTE